VRQKSFFCSAEKRVNSTCDILLFHFLGAEMNDSLLGSQLLVSTLLHNTFFEELTSDLVLQQNGPYDFYQHPNIQQVRQCQPVLDNFAKEVNGLLQEWPEHPVLVQVKTLQQMFGQNWSILELYFCVNMCIDMHRCVHAYTCLYVFCITYADVLESYLFLLKRY